MQRRVLEQCPVVAECVAVEHVHPRREGPGVLVGSDVGDHDDLGQGEGDARAKLVRAEQVVLPDRLVGMLLLWLHPPDVAHVLQVRVGERLGELLVKPAVHAQLPHARHVGARWPERRLQQQADGIVGRAGSGRRSDDAKATGAEEVVAPRSSKALAVTIVARRRRGQRQLEGRAGRGAEQARAPPILDSHHAAVGIARVGGQVDRRPLRERRIVLRCDDGHGRRQVGRAIAATPTTLPITGEATSALADDLDPERVRPGANPPQLVLPGRHPVGGDRPSAVEEPCPARACDAAEGRAQNDVRARRDGLAGVDDGQRHRRGRGFSVRGTRGRRDPGAEADEKHRGQAGALPAAGHR